MRKRSRKALALGVGIVLTILLFGLVEGSSSLLLHTRVGNYFSPRLRPADPEISRRLKKYSMLVPTSRADGEIRWHSQPRGTIDQVGMFDPRAMVVHNGAVIDLAPDITYHSRVSSKEKGLIYDIEVNTDEFGRRRTLAPSPRAKYHAIFMGCSFAFGQGVDDLHTLPSSFSRLAPDYAGYNFAFPASSIAGLLARMEKTPWTRGIIQPEGLAVYIFIPDHISRAVGSIAAVGDYSWDLPYVEDRGGMDFKFSGRFWEGQPIKSFFLSSLLKSNFGRLIHISQRAVWFPSDLDRFARMVGAAQKEYLARFPEGHFYMAFYPGQQDVVELLAPYLEKYGIHFLYYQRDILERVSEAPPEIAGEGHPSEAGTEAFAKLLIKDLLTKP